MPTSVSTDNESRANSTHTCISSASEPTSTVTNGQQLQLLDVHGGDCYNQERRNGRIREIPNYERTSTTIPSDALDSFAPNRGNSPHDCRLQLVVPAATTTASPMMSDLLLALQHQHSQGEEVNNLQFNNRVEITPQKGTNQQIMFSETDLFCDDDDEDDNFADCHSPLEVEECGAPEQNSANNSADAGLRASLDTGMAAVGRWVRSKKRLALVQEQTLEKSDESDTLLPASTRSLTSRPVRTFRAKSQIECETAAQPYAALPYSETNDARHHRQRSVSEPEMRDFVRSQSASSILRQRRQNCRPAVERQRTRANTGGHAIDQCTGIDTGTASRQSLQSTLATENAMAATTNNHMSSIPPPMNLGIGSNFSAVQFSSHTSGDAEHIIARPESPMDTIQGYLSTSGDELPVISDPERAARIRWVRINRRFQHVVTWVALLFSLLLFAILICWVMLTSA